MIVALRSNGTVVAWGDNSYGQTNVPPNLTDVVAIAAGYAHITALKSNGTVVCWGNNDVGQTTPPPDLSNVVAIATETFHNLALRRDGTVVGWGYNNAGQLNIPANLFGAVAISCGNPRSFALRGDGTIVGWGDGFSGQLNFPPTLSNVVGIAAGTYHSLALKEDGTTLTWGTYSGAYGIPGGLTNVAVIAADPGHSMVLNSDGTVDAWGHNYLQGLMQVPSGLSNVIAIAASENNHVALLGEGAPIIARPPLNRIVATNTPTSLSVAALGDMPLLYQWQLDGNNIPGATNSSLTIANVRWEDEGGYRVVVSNLYGATTTVPAFLNAVDIAEILNATNLSWSNGGNAPWLLRTAVAHDGSMAAQSGAIIVGQQSTLQTTASGPGTLSFWWKSATLPPCSGLGFSINGVGITGLTGDADWQQHTFYLPAGNYTLLWAYGNNCYQSTGAGQAWLDQVSFVPGPTIPTFTTFPSNTTVSAGLNTSFQVAAFGTPPLSYQWQLNGVDLPGATNTSLTVTNAQQIKAGTYTAVVSNGYGTNTADASLTVTPSLTILSQPASQRKVLHSTATFTLGVRGSEPFAYQWQFNGTNLDGATNSMLTLNDLHPGNHGTYQVVVSNVFGALVSTNAILTVSSTLVVGWGNNLYSQTNVPFTLTNPIAVAAGGYHGLALRADGAIAAWGDNRLGQANAPAGLSNVVAISAGLYHSLALKADGTLAAWGAGTNVTFSPNLGQSRIHAGLSNVIAIAGGGYHTTVLKADATVFSWGDNTYGQTNSQSGLSNVVQIAAGQYHNLALRRDGTVAAWGAGTNMSFPPHLGQSLVPTGLSNVVSVAAGGLHSVALKSDGTIVAWGSNTYGQTNTPVGLTNAVTISAGLYHTVAVLSNGISIAWGAGTNTTAQPHFGQSRIPIGLTNTVGTAGGGFYSLALINDGSPFVVRQPWNWEQKSGGNISLSVTAVGLSPLSHQWEFNGSSLVGETNSILLLTNVSLSRAGNYQCVVSNALGFVRSSSAILKILRTSPEFEVQELTNEGFELHLKGLTGHGEIVFYASTNLVDWAPIFTNSPVSGNLKLVDSVATNLPARFYRAEEH